MQWDYGDESEDFDIKAPGLLIVNEGNFQYSNSSLSFYNPETNEDINNVFYHANGMKLGDVAQSMTIHDNKGWIVVNNSHVVFAIDLDSFREIGRIENLPSPRYIHFVSDDKAYVSQIWTNRIAIVNPRTYALTGYIEVPDMAPESGSTEQMVQIGKYVYCSCWSYQDRIIKIDTESDRVVGEVRVGLQPKSLVKDNGNRLWVITDGGYEGSPFGYERPALVCIEPEEMAVVRRFEFSLGDSPISLHTNSSGNELYWINGGVWRMEAAAYSLPFLPVIHDPGTRFYALTVSPNDDEIYVADALDYQQPGIIYRFTTDGLLVDKFYAGITPGAFCWKP